MALEINNSADVCTLKMTEDLTIFYVAEYHAKLLAECDFQGKVELDLAEIEDADTAGVQLILSLEKKVNEAGGKISMQASSEEIDTVFGIFGLSQHFNASSETE